MAQEEEDAGDAEKPKRRRKSRKTGDATRRVPRKRPGEPGYDPYDFDSEEEDSQEGE